MIKTMNELQTADLIFTRDGETYLTFINIPEGKTKKSFLSSLNKGIYIPFEMYDKMNFNHLSKEPSNDIMKVLRPRGYGSFANLNDVDKTHYLIYQRKPDVKAIKDKMSENDKDIARIYFKQGYNFVARNDDKICFFKGFPKKKDGMFWSDGEMQYAPNFVFSWLNSDYAIDLKDLKLTRK